MRFAVFAALVMTAVVACASNGGSAGGGLLMARDTVRGVVDAVGAAPATSIVLRTAGGDVAITGENRVLSQLSGVEVTLQGTANGARNFDAALVHVRAVGGVPAIDGVLERDGAGYALRTADGSRLPLAHLPAGLAGRIGSRVWLAGPLDRAAEAYGVILP